MNTSETLSPINRVSQIIDLICKAIGFHTIPRYTPWGNTPAIPPSIAERAWTRLVRAKAAIRALMVRFQAGTLRPCAPRGPLSKPRARTAPAQPPLPRLLGWLCNHVPGEAAIRGNHLRLALAEPEMQALLAATPRAAAILKPVCRMLGLEAGILTPIGPVSQAQPAVATRAHPKSAHPETAHVEPHPTPANPPSILRPVPS